MSDETPPLESTTPESTTPVYTKEQKDKKLVAGILAIVLGWLGVHKFILGHTKEGIIMLLVSIVGFFICGIPTALVSAIGLVEGIIYLTKTDDEFVSTYLVGKKPWF